MDQQLINDSTLMEQPSISPNVAYGNGRDNLDVQTLVEQIWLELDNTVERSVIDQAVQEILPRFEGAPVKSFIPIFIRKEVLDRLKRNE